MKKCGKCEKQKNKKEFSKNVRTKDGLNAFCKECDSIKHRLNRADNPETIKSKKLFNKYGITLEEYNNILHNQGYVCAHCKLPERKIDYRTGKLHALCVDHDHETGKVRGLLCMLCNTRLEYIIKYIKELDFREAIDIYLNK